MVMCGVLFEVRTGFLNIIEAPGFIGLKCALVSIRNILVCHPYVRAYNYRTGFPVAG
jgi:hypothetical protein